MNFYFNFNYRISVFKNNIYFSAEIYFLLFAGNIFSLLSFSVVIAVFKGEGNGITQEYSCLENPRDGGAWWAAVHGVAQSRHD